MKQLFTASRGWVESIKLCFSRQVRSMGEFACAEESKVLSGVPASYRRSPEALVFPVDRTQKPAIFSSTSNRVLHVFCVGSFSEVFNAVIRALPIYVVDLVGRPCTMNIEPSKPMSKVLDVINSDDPVATTYLRTGNLSNTHPSVQTYSARKHASVRVVIEKFAQACCGKIGLNHDVVPVKQLIGEKPRSVSALSGLRYFTGQPSNLQLAFGG